MYQTRLTRIANQMRTAAIEQLIVSDPDSVFYLTGKHIHPGERLMVALVDQTSTLKVFIHEMFKVSLPVGEVIYYTDVDQPIAILNEHLTANSTIGVDKDWPARFVLPLIDCYDGYVELGSACIDAVRIAKDETEIALMVRASQQNDEAMAIVEQLICNHALTELEVQARIADVFNDVAADGLSFTPIVCYGANAAEPHHEPDDSHLSEGSVIVDMGCVTDHYCSDMTRSFYRGEPTADYKRAYQAVLTANEQAIAAVKPGVALRDIDAIARGVITDAGFGDYFIHRTGHGIGIAVHEYPDVSATSDSVCQEGMIFSIEPGVYIPEKYGIRIEDLVLVTADGHQVLNNYPKSLRRI